MATEPDKRIISFIRRHHVLTLATASNDQPWCANLFYAWQKKEGFFVFSSDHTTRHISEVSGENRVAASIVLETKVVGKLRGLQIEGRLYRAKDSALEGVAYGSYIKKFPFAAAANLELWILVPAMIKFTDNTLGFGKKIIWNNENTLGI